MVGMALATTLLALVVAILGYVLKNAHDRIDEVHDRVDSMIQNTAARSPAAVTAAIEDLRTALAQVQATNRREFGSIWKRLGLSRRPPPVDEAEDDVRDIEPANDDSFTAMLALQSTDPVKPK